MGKESSLLGILAIGIGIGIIGKILSEAAKNKGIVYRCWNCNHVLSKEKHPQYCPNCNAHQNWNAINEQQQLLPA